jgi:hypothetical protein
MLDNRKKKYISPEVDEYLVDGEISLVLMTYTDPNNPPGGGDTPPGGAAAQSSTFEENPFNETNLQ